MSESALVGKVWNYAHGLKGEGMSYLDYTQQITFLLFLKMDAEARDLGLDSPVPEGCRWERLIAHSGAALQEHYTGVLASLARAPGLLGTIFKNAQNRFTAPARLQKLIGLIDAEAWMGLKVDLKGAIYEGLLERNAAEVEIGGRAVFHPSPAHPRNRGGNAPEARANDRRSRVRHRRLSAGSI